MDPVVHLPVPPQVPRPLVSVNKLRHDADQFAHLRARRLLGEEFDAIIADYRDIAATLAESGPETRRRLDGELHSRIGHVYNRIVYVAEAQRVDQVLSPTWDSAAAESQYLSHPQGLVVIDDFLTPDVLAKVQRYCVESTVWSGTRYSEGRLGAFYLDGFNAPLLLQIAEALRAAFPRVIGDHPLREIWGFKYAPSAGINSSTHADFAAVNVNMWITSTHANLDADGCGLIVYDVAAPLAWDFDTYNRQPDFLDRYLRDRGATATVIPYRANRAVIFNSDLFHATAPIRFRPEYELRRVNITFLFGDRVDDRHHPSPNDLAHVGQAWRSAALTRARRR